MTSWMPGRPDGTEFAPYAQAYVELVDGADIVVALRTQAAATTALLRAVDETFSQTYAYEPGKWTLKEVLAHVSDCERIFAYRTLAIARREPLPLPGFDQEQYARASGANGCSLTALLAEFASVRTATVTLFANLPRDAWSRRGTVNNYSVTVRGLAFHIAGHEQHHVGILRRRYLSHSVHNE